MTLTPAWDELGTAVATLVAHEWTGSVLRTPSWHCSTPGWTAELDSWPDAPEPSVAHDEDDGDESSSRRTSRRTTWGPATESFVVDLTGPMPTLTVPDEPTSARRRGRGAVPVEPPPTYPSARRRWSSP